MNDFRVIAIKTGKDTKQNGMYKIIKENYLYNFFSCFEFVNDDFSDIQYNKSRDFHVYNLKSHKGISLNINAIVGENGSGKSSLVELFYLASYNLGCILGCLKKDKKRIKSEYYIDMEIFYSINKEEFFLVEIVNDKVFRSKYKKDSNCKIELIVNSKCQLTELNELQDYFYTIAVNYSHYALNSLEIGSWINHLFHKNDGYQTPIVINPKRNEGNICINTEHKLLNRRLASNLLEDIGDLKELDSLRNIGNDKVVKYLTLEFDHQYILNLEERFEDYLSSSYYENILEIINAYFRTGLTLEIIQDNYLLDISFKYISLKLDKIAESYDQFGVNNFKDIEVYLLELINSSSHIAFKIKGAILFLVYFERILGNKDISSSHIFNVSLEHYSKQILNIAEETNLFVNASVMSPPSFFKVRFNLSDGTNFNSLSSGERQSIFSISSIIYHIININSVESKDYHEAYTKFNYINVIFDEVELYYHPELQRMYIFNLLNTLDRVNCKDFNNILGINITFLTHSPYILSDIPHSNILRLKRGEVDDREDFRCFGANIHEMLEKDFFMNRGSIGEYSKEYIRKIIQKIEKSEMQNTNILKEIRLIGEPVIRYKLLEMYNFKFEKIEALNSIRQLIEENNIQIEDI